MCRKAYRGFVLWCARNDAPGGTNDESAKRALLIVDDDESYLKLIRKWMSEDYKAIAVKSGLQALKYLEGHRPDLVLLGLFVKCCGVKREKNFSSSFFMHKWQ